MAFLIRELTEDVQYISESVGDDGKKHLFIEGVFLMGNQPNRNKRIYPVGLLEREVERYSRDYVSKNRAYGELDHPKGNSINLDRVSHMITELHRDGDNFYGKAKVLDALPMGKIVKGIIESGGSLAVSSRGAGSLKRNSKGIMEVQEDFYLSTAADVVADPSAQIAYVNGIREGFEWVFDLAEGQHITHGTMETYDVVEKQIEELKEVKFVDPAKALHMFEQFVRSIK